MLLNISFIVLTILLFLAIYIKNKKIKVICETILCLDATFICIFRNMQLKQSFVKDMKLLLITIVIIILILLINLCIEKIKNRKD